MIHLGTYIFDSESLSYLNLQLGSLLVSLHYITNSLSCIKTKSRLQSGILNSSPLFKVATVNIFMFKIHLMSFTRLLEIGFEH